MPAPTLYVPDIVLDAVITALGAFIQPFVGAATIVRGYQNLTAPPVDPFVELIELLRGDIETPSGSYDNDNLVLDVTAKQWLDVQVNILGPSAGDQAAAIKATYRTPYAPAQFPNGIAPLTCDEPRCNPAIYGAQQYDYRWTLTLRVQYNPAVVVPMQSADTLAIATLEALSK